MEKALSKYYRSISKCLPVEKKHKKQILEQIRHSVEDYRAENPAADIQGILEHFGTPQEIAAAYIDEMTTTEIQKKFKITKRVIVIVCTAIALALILWATVLVAAWVDAQKSFDGFYDVGPVIESDMGEYE